MEKEHWYKIGYLPSGDTVYQSSQGDFAKEMDYEFLVGMTQEELRQVMPENPKRGGESEIQPYYLSYLRRYGEPRSLLDYITWIKGKHQEFEGETGLSLPYHTETQNQFLKWLQHKEENHGNVV